MAAERAAEFLGASARHEVFNGGRGLPVLREGLGQRLPWEFRVIFRICDANDRGRQCD
jgi:hypothetical protein